LGEEEIMDKATILIILWVSLVVGIFVIGEYYACNPKNSLAAQINWAGNPECK
jgi:Na+-transporting NADH:ubiquinone oxidoreductase subunit NqrC